MSTPTLRAQVLMLLATRPSLTAPGYLQNIGIMWYKDNPDSFWWASRYNVNTAAAHYLIKVFVPNTDIVGGIAGNAVSRTILEKAARTMTDGFGGT